MKENLKLYRILVVVFLFTAIGLVFMNINLLKNSYLSKARSVSSNDIKKSITKTYGYSDILNILKEDENLDIININNVTDNKNLVKTDLRYLGQVEGLYHTLENLKSEDCFISIERIKINKVENQIKDITFTITFLKDK